MLNATEENPVSGAYLLDTEATAQLLGVCPRTVARMNVTGKLPRPVRLGRCVRWNRHELILWMNYDCPSRERWQPIWQGLRGSSLN